ncbi:BCS1 N terminal-domain-containing protein [Halteromyces radiatus]|uniref:BCS1 N terminal-domain-containing protein n=1 Tax=Halteromyces radiatus TaxID=101107 RepID=UPI00222013D8|nr:BCS1 N terminal-domain-containing protein [Halteromyces radiatus]KAI8084916.1 BCS1 N terminal-domain-containing protein [Halteromyces radiatus]
MPLMSLTSDSSIPPTSPSSNSIDNTSSHIKNNDLTSTISNKDGGLFDNISNNPYFSAGFGLLGVGAAMTLLRRGSTVGAAYLRRRLLVTLEIPSKDKSYLWFLQWMSHQAPKRQVQHLAVETSYRQHDNGSVTTKFGLVPGPGTHYFKWHGIWMQVQRQRDGKMMDLSTGSPWETITVTTLSRDRHILTELLKEAQEMALQKQQGKTVIYTSYGPEWRPFGMPRRRRMLDSVILDTGIKERIVNDVKAFIGNGQWYNERGIPYRRGYLLYGEPGSGKSSFIQALAGELEYNICILNLSERGLTDDRLNHLLSNVPERSIMLLEDVDAAFTKRAQSDNQGYQSMITFSGLLNALDGVASAEERIIFLTTNHIEKLDPALIRPGRVDLKEHLGNATDHQIRGMFTRFYQDRPDLANVFVDKLKNHKVSTASLQGHFVYFKDKPEEAIEHVDLLWHQL